MNNAHVDAGDNGTGEEMTIEKLAHMVARGFQHGDQRFDAMDTRFDEVGSRLDRIEHLLIAEHRQRIEKLEREMRELKESLAI